MMNASGHVRRVLTSIAAVTTSALACAGLLVPSANAGPAPHPLINEVYGGGGNSGATLTHDFVELVNPTSETISLDGYVVEYYGATGNRGNRCTLSGSVAPGGYFLVQQAKGAGGTQALPTPDATCGANMSGTKGSVQLVGPDGTVVDLVGYGADTKAEGKPTKALSNTTSAQRRGLEDTDDNSADFVIGTPSPMNSASTPAPSTPGTPDPTGSPTPSGSATPTAPETPAGQTSIADIQGTTDTSPMVGRTVTTTGVITAAYPKGGFNGLYIQTPGTGGVAKTPTDASDGIFVHSAKAASAYTAGQCVVVSGEVSEFNGLTEINGTSVTETKGCADVKPVKLAALPRTDAQREAYESMLVEPQGTYTISNNYQLNQFGTVGLAFGTEPLYQGTEVARPGEDAKKVEDENRARSINLDDGASWNYQTNDEAKDSPLPYLSQDTPMRTGSHVGFTKPVIMDYRFGWNLQPTGMVSGAQSPNSPITTTNDRPAKAPSFDSDLKLASFNVLNYFTDLGKDEDGCKAYTDRTGTPVTANFCTVRGAYTQEAFHDQQAKIVTAINGLDADVVALMEVENSASITYLPGQPRDKALAHLVDELNKAAGSQVWGYVASPTVVPPHEDVIRTAFIYRLDSVRPEGPSLILMDDAYANARQPLAQKFVVKDARGSFVAVANHFKSKGSGEDDGTGQGRSNPSRIAQAQALLDWSAKEFADEPVFLLGDFNAYGMEDPVMKIKDAGYTEVVEQLAPGASTFQYGGRLGSLDHIFANAAAMRMVHGAGVWDINADESIAMQYSRRNYNVTDFHTSGPWAASDHDPALVGITFPGTSTPQPSGTPSVEPSASVSSQPSGEPSVSPTASSATPSVTPGGSSATPAPSLTPVPSLPGGTPGTPSATPAGASASAHGTGTDDVSGDAAQAAVVPGGSADLPALPATGI
ncbi:putative extracellular nuclease [Cutibacterium granulosum TM11]|uniref:Extracellular nuclease n=1 Tax=Cutibacterium granulosum TM11 TaxID=1292373 RepID=A0ACB4UP15_9ACTN|nr:putative extracellular nuclease [Cutibacterium granulosum TM11]